MKKDNRKPIKKFMSRLVTLTCLGVFLFAAHGLYDIFMDYYKNRQLLDDVQETFYNAASAEEGKSADNGKVRPGFAELLKQNTDVVGWITMDGTQIDYPILQSSDNEFYLNQNYDHRDSRAGSIFMDYRNDVQMSDLNTIIYGHRMKDGSMFQHLTKYLDDDFLKAHPTFEYDTLYESYEAEIFAVYNTMTEFDYIKTDFQTNDEFNAFLQEIEKESKVTTDVDVGVGNRILTLSTCDYQLDQQKGRLVVQAKLIKK